jgi:hypothetical protein
MKENNLTEILSLDNKLGNQRRQNLKLTRPISLMPAHVFPRSDDEGTGAGRTYSPVEDTYHGAKEDLEAVEKPPEQKEA